jgi:hypothetical protein
MGNNSGVPSLIGRARAVELMQLDPTTGVTIAIGVLT